MEGDNSDERNDPRIIADKLQDLGQQEKRQFQQGWRFLTADAYDDSRQLREVVDEASAPKGFSEDNIHERLQSAHNNAGQRLETVPRVEQVPRAEAVGEVQGSIAGVRHDPSLHAKASA